MFGLEKSKNSEKNSRELELEHDRLNRQFSFIFKELEGLLGSAAVDIASFSDDMKTKAILLLKQIETEKKLPSVLDEFLTGS